MRPQGRPKGSWPLERSERETMTPPGRPKGSWPLERSERETQ
jgi:hypothetical protein